MNLVSRLPAADKASRDAFAEVDIAGYNYAYGRYRGDRKRYPDRVIVGSESMPGDLPAIWRAGRGAARTSSATSAGPGGTTSAKRASASGRTGRMPVGSTSRSPPCSPAPVRSTSPACRARRRSSPRPCGGELDAPAIAVRPLDHAGERANKTPWRTSDAIPSWSWRGQGRSRRDRGLLRRRPGRAAPQRPVARPQARRPQGRLRHEVPDRRTNPVSSSPSDTAAAVETGRSSLRSAEKAQPDRARGEPGARRSRRRHVRLGRTGRRERHRRNRRRRSGHGRRERSRCARRARQRRARNHRVVRRRHARHATVAVRSPSSAARANPVP